MPFYEVAGHDTRTHKPRTVRMSARNEHEAEFTASQHGIAEVKLRPYTDREMLLMDMKCFIYADPQAPIKAKKMRLEKQYPKSLLIDHPFLTIVSSVYIALLLLRFTDLLIAQL